jgi:hypothetical protein
MPPPRLVDRGSQAGDMFRQQPQPPLSEINGEEEAAAGQEIATIAGHADVLAR